MTSTPRQLREAESNAYRQLIAEIDAADADPSRWSASVLETPWFDNFMAGWIGVEATSLYVTPQSATNGEGLEFLVVAPPIFICSMTTPGPAGFYARYRLDQASAQRRRAVQSDFLKDQRTSAALCAKYLQNLGPSGPRYLLLHFAETLGYSFIYSLIKMGSSPANTADARDLALEAWNKLCGIHAKRSGGVADAVPDDLLRVLLEWYERVDARDGPYFRDFPRGRQILAIYKIDAPLKVKLTACVRTPTEKAIGSFVTDWAATLLRSLTSLGSESNNPEDLFWATTLINPRVEEEFLTRGLYVTIIRSPLVGTAAPSKLSQAYAICTLYDSSRLESEERRLHLDVVLRRIAHEDLARYDYRTLQEIYERTEQRLNHTEQRLNHTEHIQSSLRELQEATSDPDVDYEQLVEKTANACHRLANAVGVLVSSPDIGVYSSWRTPGEDADRTRWCGPFSGVVQAALVLAAELHADESGGYDQVQELAASRYVGELKRIFGGLELSSAESYRYGALLVETDPRGLLLLFFNGLPASTEVSVEIHGVAELLAIGMAMPFRSASRRGLLSKSGSVAAHPLDSLRRAWAWCRSWGRDRNDIGDGRHRRDSFQWLLDLSVATIVEVTRAGLVLIALMLTASVFLTLWGRLWYSSGWHGQEARSLWENSNRDLEAGRAIVETLRHVEAAVMAFSICFAATGVVFLLRPGLATGQPKWMRRFAEPGTLEQSLVRLAAMVLTIDVLSVALDPLSTRQQTLYRVLVYLCILIGLAFLSAFLLADEQVDRSVGEEHAEDARNEDSMSSAWSRLSRRPLRSLRDGKSRGGRQ